MKIVICFLIALFFCGVVPYFLVWYDEKNWYQEGERLRKLYWFDKEYWR